MSLVKTIIYCVGWLFLTTPLFLCGQTNANKTFLTGYYGGGSIDSLYKNYVYIERSDTGLAFTKCPVENYYDFVSSQNSTYCDENGTPVLQWHGCYLLDSKTLSPIENGDFNFGIGTVSEGGNFCGIIKHPNDPGPGAVSPYAFNYGSFFLDIGDRDNLLLVYYRLQNERTISLRLASIDLDGGINDEPIVTFKDSVLVPGINLKSGSINAIKHANGKDWFIVFSELYAPNWYSILVDKHGVHSPVKSVIAEHDSTKYFSGTTIFSPDGKKCATHYKQEFFVFDFDRCDGTFRFFYRDTIPYDINSTIFGYTEFSPNSRFIYLNNLTHIYQYDLEAQDIFSSRTLIAEFDFTQDSGIPGHSYVPGVFTTPFRGKDGRLYYWSGNTVPKIHRIAYPDRKGPDVGWTQYYYTLPVYPTWYAPTLVDYDTPALPEPCELSTDNGSERFELKCYPNPAGDFIRFAFPDRYNFTEGRLIDMNGRVVWRGKAGELKEGIYIYTLTAGVYHVLLDGRFAGRFVKI